MSWNVGRFFSVNYIIEHISDTQFGIMDNSKAYIVKNDIMNETGFVLYVKHKIDIQALIERI
jgi:hypothetical protein